MDYLQKLSEILTFISLIFLFLDLFINLPMNGVYNLPGNWSKDATIIAGLIAAFILSVYLVRSYGLTIPLYITIPYVYLYWTSTYVHLMTLVRLFQPKEDPPPPLIPM